MCFVGNRKWNSIYKSGSPVNKLEGEIQWLGITKQKYEEKLQLMLLSMTSSDELEKKIMQC